MGRLHDEKTFLFVDSKTNGDEKTAQKALDALIYVGKLEEERAGDLFWRDLANYYKNVSNEKISDLKQAQDLVKKGNDNCLNGRYEEALIEFEVLIHGCCTCIKSCNG